MWKCKNDYHSYHYFTTYMKFIGVIKFMNKFGWIDEQCGAPNYQQNDICWKCQFDRRTALAEKKEEEEGEKK